MRTLPELFREPALAGSLSVAEWSDLLPRLKGAGLLAHLGELLRLNEVLTAHLPPAVQRQIAAAQAIAAARERSCRWECGEISRAASGSGIPMMVVKGAAYVLAGALPGRGRWLTDVDLLAPQEALPELERLLVGAGWVTSAADDQEKTSYFRRWLHQVPPLSHGVRKSMVDLHHTIIAPWGGYRFQSELLFDAALPSAVPGILLPSLTDRCLIAAAHFVRSDSASGAFRDLLDLSELMAECAAAGITEQQLQQRAAAIGIERALQRASAMAAVFYQLPLYSSGRQAAAWQARALIPDGISLPGPLTRMVRRWQKVQAFRAALPLRVMAQRTIQRRLGLGHQVPSEGAAQESIGT